jgi:hypothetical protein
MMDDLTIGLVLGFIGGCVFTYFSLVLPIVKLDKAYQERLEARLRGKS